MNAFAWTSSAPVDTRTPEFCGRPSSVAKRMPTTAELASFTVFSASEASGAMSFSSSAAVGAGTARMTWSYALSSPPLRRYFGASAESSRLIAEMNASM